MSDKAFVDTNILVYAHDVSAGHKHERARAVVEGLWATRSGVLSTQVLQELCVNLRRTASHPLDARSTRDIITDYLTWDVRVNTGEAVLEALAIAERFQISFWDALILHAADAADASVLYSEDLSDGQRYGEVRVVNPLRDESGGRAS
ncbi:MAG: PIN domain-containing protein [Candidatus Eremiobacteraeota bacterium]|nr:PIN domain-containing protein [Candidatus Eremiobacteraeota bacterium]